MAAAKIVTISGTRLLYKGDDPADSIELVGLVEVGNCIVAQKGLYQVGDKALFIEPDYCLPDTPMFQEYIRPGGDERKCRLGRNGRIRAIKFNLHTGDGQPVYSYGILIPFVDITIDELMRQSDMDKYLGIKKYEEPEPFQGHKGKVVSIPFPEQMYKTDELNINNVINQMEFPIRLIGLWKIDGSSCSIWCKNGKSGIASRNQGKPLTYKKVVGYKKPNLFFKFLMFFGYKYDGKVIKSVESDDQFVVYGKPYLAKLIEYCELYDIDLVLRGELRGKSCKGSGNPNNPHAKVENDIEFFGIDDYTHSAVKLPYSEVKKIASGLGIKLVHEYFNEEFKDKDHLLSTCQTLFSYHEKFNGKVIEGVVVRNEEGTFSAKIMNLSYDSKK